MPKGHSKNPEITSQKKSEAIKKFWSYPFNREMMMKKQNKGEGSANWKGNNVGYMALHTWIRKKLGLANNCQNPNCHYPRKDRRGYLMEKPKKFEWANVDHQYQRKAEDFISLCTSCHRMFDLGIIKLLQMENENYD